MTWKFSKANPNEKKNTIIISVDLMELKIRRIIWPLAVMLGSNVDQE